MHLGLIGPCKQNPAVLRARAQFLLDEIQVDRAVYLGVDGALDEVVRAWARSLVQGEPSDDSVWGRAAELCSKAAPPEIDAFLAAERQRQRLKALECLQHATSRTIELFETVVAVLIHDKALLDEEDMLPASLLAFGKSAEPIIHKIGARCFVSPGPANHPGGGVMVLRDESDVVTASIYAPDGACVQKEVVAQPMRMARLTVQGATT